MRLKNPLFPLQLTIENLQRARKQTPEQFDEIFAEATATLRTEIENLKSVIARFSDFSKMPQPQLQSVNLNEEVRSAMRLHRGAINAIGRHSIDVEVYPTKTSGSWPIPSCCIARFQSGVEFH